MYSEYFRLKEPPFSLSPDPRFLFMSERHREGMAHLFYGIRQPGGFVLLTGEIGSGKTTLCRSLVKQLPAETDVALILNPRLTVIELLANICDELRVPYPAATKSIKILIDALNRRLLETFAQGRRTVVIIDEAQNLQIEVLEQIRLLTNLETAQEKLLQIILIGQPELLQVLRQKRLLQLAQRITAQYHLLPLARRGTFAYIRHRLSVAGGSNSLFTAPAMLQVHRLSAGVPRLINILCDRALLGAYSLDRRRVNAGIIFHAHRETRGFIPWYRRIRPAWNAWYAGLAILLVGGAFYIGTDSLSLYRRNTAATGATAPITKSEPARTLPMQNSNRSIVSEPGLPHGSPGAGTADGSPVQEGGANPGLSRGSVESGSKAEEVGISPANKRNSDSGSSAPRLENILADPRLRGRIYSSFASLYARMGLKIPEDRLALGCKAGAEQGFDCLYRVGNWTKLRYYDLPAILELTLPSGLHHRVTLVGLGDENATLMIGDREYTFPRQEIDSLWDGSFILIWKMPFPARQIALGAQGEAVVWLRQTLDALEGKPAGTGESDLYDKSLRQRIMDFQRSRSLPQDGMVGNITLVRLALAVMGPNAPSISHYAP